MKKKAWKGLRRKGATPKRRPARGAAADTEGSNLRERAYGTKRAAKSGRATRSKRAKTSMRAKRARRGR